MVPDYVAIAQACTNTSDLAITANATECIQGQRDTWNWIKEVMKVIMFAKQLGKGFYLTELGPTESPKIVSCEKKKY